MAAERPSLSGEPVIDVALDGGTAVVRLTGELDLYNADQVRQGLARALDASPDCLIVDLERVDFIDSTALGVLVEARRRLADGTKFRLAAPGVEVRRALEISGLNRHFAVDDTVESAVNAHSRSSA
jgi:anti-sigma B factor antagonist